MIVTFDSIKFKNWFGYANEEHTLSLSGNTLTQIIGQNGVGKSTLALIIEEVLYNKNHSGILKGSIANRNTINETSATLSFNVDSDCYEVVTNRKSSNKVTLLKNGIDISSHKTPDTYKEIESIIGLNFEVFSSLIYQSSTANLSFLKDTDSQRKKFLTNLLQLSEYEKYYNITKSLLDDINKEINYTNGSIDTLTNARKSLIVKELIAIVPEPVISAGLVDEVNSLQEQIKNIDFINKDIEENNNKAKQKANIVNSIESITRDINILNVYPHKEFDDLITALREELLSITNDINNITTRNQEVLKHNEKVDKRKKLIDAWDKKEEELRLLIPVNEPIKPVLGEIQKDINFKLSSNTETITFFSNHDHCPTCLQEISTSFKESYLDKLNTENTKYQEVICAQRLIEENNLKKELEYKESIKMYMQYTNTYTKLMQEIKNIKDTLEYLEEYKEYKNTSNIKELSNQYSELKANLDLLINEKSIYDKNAKELASLKTKLESQKEILNSMFSDKEYSIKSLINTIDLSNTLSTKLNQLKFERNQIQVIKEQNERAEKFNIEMQMIINAYNAYTSNLNEENYRLNLLEDKRRYIEILKKTFSPSGLIAYRLEHSVKFLESSINTYLSELSNGRFILEFKLENEKLNIIILDNGLETNIASLSAGELARVNIATLLAIRSMLSILSKVKINILFLDEVMGVLDAEGKDKLINILLEEKDLNVFLVDHTYEHPLLNTIYIKKENNVSRIYT
jgi:DNA repair exonuclease SbcCD ATPase subunit